VKGSLSTRSLLAVAGLLLAALLYGAPGAAAGDEAAEKAPSRAAENAPPKLDARAWILVDARDGDLLTSHAPDRRLPIASTTKLMTAYLSLHELPLHKRVTMLPYDAIPGESLLGVPAGVRISVHDLLYGLILRSGNDAAFTLADAAAGSESAFVRQMNRRAAALGLSNTHYSNAIGLDAPGNYSSARDLVTLSRRLLQIPVFRRIADSRSAVLRSLDPNARIDTLNTLLQLEPWANGVKTGHTIGARYVLVGSGRRKGVELISAVLGAPTESQRDSETISLLDQGFSEYRLRHPVRRGRELADPEIRYSGGELPLRAVRTVAVGIRRGQHLRVTVRAPQEVEGPIPRGRRLGTATVSVDGRRAAVVPLRSARAIPEATSFDRVRTFISEHPIPLLAAVLVILGAAVLLRRLWRGLRQRRTENEEEKSVSPEQTQSERAERQTEREQQRGGDPGGGPA
jgi:D-alanyl-D-alanine carboxypeptidase (penicillin-binding protein 5/6)